MKEGFSTDGTFYVDIDRTLFVYKDLDVEKGEEPSVVPATKMKLQQVKDQGHVIVLTTSRPEENRDEITFQLTKNNIPYTMLVMNVPESNKHL